MATVDEKRLAIDTSLSIFSHYKAHLDRVNTICERVKAKPKGVKLAVKKSTKSHQVYESAPWKKTGHSVDVNELKNILNIDTKSMTAVAEGQVTLQQLCETTLELGLLPRVVPEFASMTIGGLINGNGANSTAHKYGSFADAVLACEVVLGNGDRVECDRSHNEFLMACLMPSFGTLGIVTAAMIQLMPASRLVHSRYYHFTNIDDYLAKFYDVLGVAPTTVAASSSSTSSSSSSSSPAMQLRPISEERLTKTPLFIEGVVYSPESYMLITGDFLPPSDPDCKEDDEKKRRLPTFHPVDPKREGLEWFYEYAQRVSKTGTPQKPYEDLIPSIEYLFRSERGFFWVLQIVAQDNGLLCHTNWGRRWLDNQARLQELNPNSWNMGLTFEERERCMVMQDVPVAIEDIKTGIQYVQKNLNLYPIWNLPARNLYDVHPALNRVDNQFTSLYVMDIGLYGEPMCADYHNCRQMRELQSRFGAPCWGMCYLQPEELRKWYRYNDYTLARKAFHADDAFSHIEDKIHFSDPTKDPGKLWFWRQRQSWRQGHKCLVIASFSIQILFLLLVLWILFPVGRYCARFIF